jgi:hypothetical protein
MMRIMQRLLLFVATSLFFLPSLASAQDDDVAYCNKLGALATRFIGGAGGDGRLSPDLNVLGAVDDCNKGKAAKSIPYLEKRLRDQRITVPPR